MRIANRIAIRIMRSHRPGELAVAPGDRDRAAEVTVGEGLSNQTVADTAKPLLPPAQWAELLRLLYGGLKPRGIFAVTFLSVVVAGLLGVLMLAAMVPSLFRWLPDPIEPGRGRPHGTQGPLATGGGRGGSTPAARLAAGINDESTSSIVQAPGQASGESVVTVTSITSAGEVIGVPATTIGGGSGAGLGSIPPSTSGAPGIVSSTLLPTTAAVPTTTLPDPSTTGPVTTPSVPTTTLPGSTLPSPTKPHPPTTTPRPPHPTLPVTTPTLPHPPTTPTLPPPPTLPLPGRGLPVRI